MVRGTSHLPCRRPPSEDAGDSQDPQVRRPLSVRGRRQLNWRIDYAKGQIAGYTLGGRRALFSMGGARDGRTECYLEREMFDFRKSHLLD